MKRSAAEILHEYGPSRVSTTCVGLRLTASTSGLRPATS